MWGEESPGIEDGSGVEYAVSLRMMLAFHSALVGQVWLLDFELLFIRSESYRASGGSLKSVSVQSLSPPFTRDDPGHSYYD